MGRVPQHSQKIWHLEKKTPPNVFFTLLFYQKLKIGSSLQINEIVCINFFYYKIFLCISAENTFENQKNRQIRIFRIAALLFISDDFNINIKCRCIIWLLVSTVNFLLISTNEAQDLNLLWLQKLNHSLIYKLSSWSYTLITFGSPSPPVRAS